MFNKDFYPTPDDVIVFMLNAHDVKGKIVLEPSAGKGNIVDYLTLHGASEVLACENNQDLAEIVSSKCRFLQHDFLTLKSEDISHVDMIVMNPPFSADDKHILHAWNIAPDSCFIIALCNYQTLENDYSYNRRELKSIIREYGFSEELEGAFKEAERTTGVSVGVIRIQKPGQPKGNEFEGFFTEEDPAELQVNGLMPYNAIRDIVNRYVQMVKLFDQQIELGVQMNALTSNFFYSKLGFQVTEKDKPITRNTFKKELQKSAWDFIFGKLGMEKYITKGLRNDLNRFIETQQHIPFTMRNIYQMLSLISQTHGQRMDKALLDVFDRLTTHYHDNRYNVPGWKTNSHYLMNIKFIMPWVTTPAFSRGGMSVHYNSGNVEIIDDMQKAICFMTGFDYKECTSLLYFCRKIDAQFGQWYSWGFFEIKGFKKGTMHFRFQNEDLWAQFNQNIARIKGYPLFEHNKNNQQ